MKPIESVVRIRVPTALSQR